MNTLSFGILAMAAAITPLLSNVLFFLLFQDMVYWGIDDLYLEPCCVQRYYQQRELLNWDHQVKIKFNRFTSPIQYGKLFFRRKKRRRRRCSATVGWGSCRRYSGTSLRNHTPLWEPGYGHIFRVFETLLSMFSHSDRGHHLHHLYYNIYRRPHPEHPTLLLGQGPPGKDMLDLSKLSRL